LAIRKFAPNFESAFPHNYGESRGTHRYDDIPTPDQQIKREYQIKAHLESVEKLRSGELVGDIPKSLLGVDVGLSGNPVPPEWSLIPQGIAEHRDYLKPLSTVAWSHEFDAHGRTWLVTADLALVPKDRVAPYPRSEFAGVELGESMTLPIAFVRYSDRPKYKLGDDGVVRETGENWARLSILPVEDSGLIDIGGKNYYRIRGTGELALVDDVTVAVPSLSTPWGTPVDGQFGGYKRRDDVPPVRAVAGGRGTWVEVSVLGGWMIAYEDTKPVFATLIAPGRGGIPTRGVDPLETASTPIGLFRVNGKFQTATMANSAFVHSDVPYSQNFSGPHVLHQAYWHDGWGEKRSAGCVNLSPKDSKWFFNWTEPPMPEGWFGMRSDNQAGPATIVWVHR